MIEVFAAFSRAARDLTRPGMLWQALWPPLAAALLWTLIAIAVWAHGMSLMTQIVPNLPWSGWEWVAHWAAMFLLLAAFATLTYFTALFLVAVVALPIMLNKVAAMHYPDLVRHGENAFWGSLGNTLGAGLVFVVGGLLSLPLLLIPGVILVLPLFWAAWLNQRTFRFDALVEHATRAEMKRLIGSQGTPFAMAGAGTAVLAHVPLLQLLAPAYTALVFVHLGLAALRRQRQEGGIDL